MSVERRTSLQESRESLLANVNVLDGTVVDLDKAVDEFSRSAWVAGLQISGIKERSLSHKGDAVELLPSMVELSGLLLPAKTRRECFDPAYGDSLSNYMLARKSRYKWGRRWFALDFTVRILIMVGGCFRVLLQNGAGKFLLGLLPESLRNWWRRQ